MNDWQIGMLSLRGEPRMVDLSNMVKKDGTSPNATREAMKRALAAMPHSTSEEVAHMTGLSIQAVKAALKRMFDIEMVKRVKDGNCFRWYL